MLDTLQFQKRWPDIHSDKVRMAIRSIPTDVAVSMPDEWLEATVRGIVHTMDRVADIVRSDEK